MASSNAFFSSDDNSTLLSFPEEISLMYVLVDSLLWRPEMRIPSFRAFKIATAKERFPPIDLNGLNLTIPVFWKDFREEFLRFSKSSLIFFKLFISKDLVTFESFLIFISRNVKVDAFIRNKSIKKI